MSVQEIYESEKRDDSNLYDIHFYMEGSFWRAYEWSAYLSRIFPSDLNEDERLKVLKKVTKGDENGYVQVGLQLSSFDKYFPGVADNESIFEMKNKHIIIHSEEFFKGNDFSDYESILNSWKDGIKLTNNEKKKNKELKAEINDSVCISADSLIKEIITYPIETKNLVENLQFLSYIKDKAIKIKNDIR